MSKSTENLNADAVLATVFLRNDFYRNKFHVALAVLLLCVMGLFGFIGMLVYLVKHPPHPVYFVADQVGKLMPDIPVSQPNMSDEEVSAWAVEAVEAANTYNYLDFTAQLQNAEKYFTLYGWKSYMNGLSASQNLSALTIRKYIVTARVVEPPKLLKAGLLDGAYGYKFSMPVLVSYWAPPYADDTKSKFENPYIVTVIIQRQRLLVGYKGLGIVQMITEFANAGAPSQNIGTTPT